MGQPLCGADAAEGQPRGLPLMQYHGRARLVLIRITPFRAAGCA